MPESSLVSDHTIHRTRLQHATLLGEDAKGLLRRSIIIIQEPFPHLRCIGVHYSYSGQSKPIKYQVKSKHKSFVYDFVQIRIVSVSPELCTASMRGIRQYCMPPSVQPLGNGHVSPNEAKVRSECWGGLAVM